MSQFLVDCPGTRADSDCTMVPFYAPPATVDHYALGPTWGLWIAAAVIIVTVVMVAVVRYKAHEEHNETERQRILHPPTQCPTCDYKLDTPA
jgi:hypothetical protein